MVKFELTDILKNLENEASSDKIMQLINSITNLSDAISMQTSDFISQVPNQTNGYDFKNGTNIMNLPPSDKTKDFIINNQEIINNFSTELIEEVYYNTIWQVFMLTQIIPTGMLYNLNNSQARCKIAKLYETWKRIIKKDSTNIPLYKYFRTFGVMVNNYENHKAKNITFYALVDDDGNSTELLKYIIDEEIDNLNVFSYSVFNKLLYDNNDGEMKILSRFDKSETMSGVIFKGTSNLITKIPSYVLKVGCSMPGKLCKDKGSIVSDPRLDFIEFKKGQSVDVQMTVPVGNIVSMINIDGETCYNVTNDIPSPGISISSKLNPFGESRTYCIRFSNLNKDTNVYIGTCTGTDIPVNHKTVVEVKGYLGLEETGGAIRLDFEHPYIFFNPNKIKVYARKTKDSEDELVDKVKCMSVDEKIVTRQDTFVGKQIEHVHQHPQHHYHTHGKRNPYVREYIGHPSHLVIDKKSSHHMSYDVYESDKIAILFDGYTDYAYFRVEFEDKVMVNSYKFINEFIDTQFDVALYFEPIELEHEVVQPPVENIGSEEGSEVEPEIPTETPDEYENYPTLSE